MLHESSACSWAESGQAPACEPGVWALTPPMAALKQSVHNPAKATVTSPKTLSRDMLWLFYTCAPVPETRPVCQQAGNPGEHVVLAGQGDQKGCSGGPGSAELSPGWY